MLTIIRRVLGLDEASEPVDRPAEIERKAETDREIEPGPPIASSGASLRRAKKSETEAALERAAGNAE